MAQNYTFDINAAMQAGYTPDQIAQYLDEQKRQGKNYQLSPTPQTTPAQSTQPIQSSGNWFTDALPTIGGMVGGVAGAAIPFLGETGVGEIGGAAVGSGLGEAAKELITGKKLSGKDIATQTALGGVGGAVGKGVGYVAGKVLPKVAQTAEALDNGSQFLKQGTRQIRVKPSIYGASKEEAINRTLDKYGVSGTAQQQYQQLQPTMSKIESLIQQEIANNPTAGADANTIKDSFMKNLQSSLRSGDLTKEQAKEEIDGYLADLKKSLSQQDDGTTKDFIPLGQLRDLKKLVNDDYGSIQKVIDNGGSLTPRQKVIQVAWESLDDAVKNASPEMKNLLKDQSNIYNAARSLSSARSNPPTLRVMGTSVPAPVTQAARDVAAGTLDTTGNLLSKTPQGVNPLVRQTAGQTLARTLVPNNGDNSQNPQQQTQSNEAQYQSGSDNNQGMLPPTPMQASGNNSTINSSGSQMLPSSPSGNPLAGYTLNGKPLDPATANMIYKIATYQLDPTKMTSLKNNERERLINIVAQFDPSYDSSQFPVKQKLREDFTTGKSSQNIRSLNTAISHLNALAQAGNALGNTSITPLNAIKNKLSESTGQPQVTRFKAALNAVAGEMATVFKGTSGTDQEIQAWREQMSDAESPEQIQAGINQMIELMAGRLQALESQYQTGMGKPADFSFLNGQSQRILQRLGIDPNALTNPDTQLPATP